MTQPATVDQYQALAERFRTGDPEAFRQLHALLDCNLQAFVTARCPRGEDVEGLVQTVWVRVWENRDDYKNEHFRGWVFTIARHLLLDEYRRQGRRPKPVPWSDRDSAEMIREDQNERISALRDCLKSVGSDFVRVLQMRIDGLSTQEIASQMNITQGAVFSRAARGRDQLRDCIDRNLGDH